MLTILCLTKSYLPTVEHDDQRNQIKSPIYHSMPLYIDLALAKSEAPIN